MSFILDALKKSENERRRKEQPDFTDLPRATPAVGTPAWALLALGALTSLVIVLGIAWWQSGASLQLEFVAGNDTGTRSERAGARNGDDSRTRTTPTDDEVEVAAALPADRSVRPLGSEARTPQTGSESAPAPERSTAPAEPPVSAAAPEPAPAPQDAPRAADQDLPSADDLIADGELGVGELHMDLHVYSSSASRRFVIVNGQRLREGEAMNDGTVVAEILPDGVIMRHRGTRFVLSRD